jgi:hypothetical protein
MSAAERMRRMRARLRHKPAGTFTQYTLTLYDLLVTYARLLLQRR